MCQKHPKGAKNVKKASKQATKSFIKCSFSVLTWEDNTKVNIKERSGRKYPLNHRCSWKGILFIKRKENYDQESHKKSCPGTQGWLQKVIKKKAFNK